MPKSKDDLEAVRNVIEALDGFEQTDQERIIRWAKEKLGFVEASNPVVRPVAKREEEEETDSALLRPIVEREVTDIRSFVASKDPKSDQHFAATIAYYYQFEAPADERKNEIVGDDLQEACRQANRTRLQYPGQTLRNAHQSGLLDKGTGVGAYKINAVGENLVAMTLPVSGKTQTPRAPNKKPKKPPAQTKIPAKKTNSSRSSAGKASSSKPQPKKASAKPKQKK